MNLNNESIKLRDKYRQEKRDSDDEFSLLDIEDVVGEAAKTAQDSTDSFINANNNSMPDAQFFDHKLIDRRKKRSSTDPGAFK